MADKDEPIESQNLSSSILDRQFWLLAGLVIVALFAGYWFFIRQGYVEILGGIEPSDAVDVVKVLETRKIPYELADEGRTILVPSNQADKARIELVGSELPMRGQVGFELFNQSDMGLTEFAQKINYQRALQGELARTILQLDDIHSVRVHLGLPQQSLFRDEQSYPKASVTLILKPGAALTASRVDGIQRIVAGAVPEMTPNAVAILDGSGRIVSTADDRPQSPTTTSDAIVQSYRQKVMAAVKSRRPSLDVDAIVSLRYIMPIKPFAKPRVTGPSEAVGITTPLPAELMASPRGDPDFALNIRIMTNSPLDNQARMELTEAVETVIDFNSAKGDTLAFIAGWTPQASDAQASNPDEQIVSKRARSWQGDPSMNWLELWPYVLGLALLALLAAIASDRLRGRKRRQAGLASFARQLQGRIEASEGERQ